MKSANEKKMSTKDISLWVAVFFLTCAAFYVTYSINISSPIETAVWLAWLILSAFFVYLTTTGKQLLQFAKESKNELLKVVWPTRQETIQTTTIVIVMVTVTGFILWGIDSAMMWTIAKITHLG